MTRPRPRLSLGTKRANRNSLLRPQAHRRSASEASLARHSPFTHPSLALHSPFTQKPRKWLTWTNAPLVQVRPRGGREAARRPRSQNSGELSQEVEPSESNAADMGVREPVDRLLACRRHPSSSARWAALDALSGLASSHTALLV